ncbi:MAG: hypothetical protein LC754_07605 [Acidobacteria bacterium]|nr:hypothetical protein [Acidobacteriota bacterium]
MRKSHSRFLAACVVASVAAAAWLAAPPRAGAQRGGTGIDTYAITNARIVTVSGPVIERGTVVFRNGLIVAVGDRVAAPPDARTIDGTGLTVYPGLFDASTTLGIPRPTPTPGGASGPGGANPFAGLFGPPTAPSATSPNSSQLPGLQPEILAADIIRPGGTEIEAARSAGITAAQTTPRGNIFLGQSAIINLAGETPQQMILRTPVALYVGLTPLGSGQYPGSLMGVFSSIRQLLLDAQRYRESNEIYARNPRGLRRPDVDKSLAALLPVLARQMPVVMQADREREIDRALDLAQEFNLQMIINGGMEADRVAARLKAMNVPVLLSLNFPKRTTAPSPEADPDPVRVLRERVEAPKTAGRLAASGVRFAFQSGGMTTMTDFLANAAKAVEQGLANLQQQGERLSGSIQGQLGSGQLASGTINGSDIRFSVPVTLPGPGTQTTDANFTGTLNGNQMSGTVQVVGRGPGTFTGTRGGGGATPSATPGTGGTTTTPARPGAIPPDGTTTTRPPAAATGTEAVNLSGTWSISVTLGPNVVPSTLVLQQQGSSLTGRIESRLGSADISDGSVNGNGFRFSTQLEIGGQSQSLIVEGTASGNQMSGNITTARGQLPFSGTRNP